MLNQKRIYIQNILYFLKLKKYKLPSNIWLKDSIIKFKIKKYMLKSKLAIYNGKFYIPLKINELMLNSMINFFFFTKSILIKADKQKRYKRKKKKK